MECIEAVHVSTIQAVIDCVSEQIPVQQNLRVYGLAVKLDKRVIPACEKSKLLCARK